MEKRNNGITEHCYSYMPAAIYRNATDLNKTMTEHCYSTDPDCYYYPSDSEEDAHAKAQHELNGTREPGSEQTYWIAEQVHPIDTIINQPKTLAWIGDNILEEIHEAIFNELLSDGEHFKMTPDKTVELVKVILDFIRKNAIVKYFGVTNEREFKHKTPPSAPTRCNASTQC